MAALPPIRRLLIEDFATQKKWISPLLLILNNFFEAVVNALNKNLTLADNTSGDIKKMTFSGTLPVSVTWTKPLPPTSVIVGNCARVDGTTVTITNAIGITWTMLNSTTLQVTSVVGITPTATAQYILTLVCFQG